jgi:CBS domain-containing protein
MVTSETKEKVETEADAKAESETEVKSEAETVEEKDKPKAKAKVDAEEKAKTEPEVKPEAEAEAAEEPKAEAEEKAKTETEAKPKTKAVEKNGKPEAKAKVEAEEKDETRPRAKTKDVTLEEKDKPKSEAKVEAEEKAETKTEAKPETKTAEEKDKPEAEAKVETEERAETEEKTTAPDQSREYVVSEAIQKLTQSMKVPSSEASPSEGWAESGKPAMETPQCGSPAHISVPSTVCTKDVMQKDVVWASPDESVQQALTKMQQHDCSYIIVGQDEALEGIVSKSDITGATSIYLRPIFAKWHGPSDDATLQIKLKWIMSRPVRTISPEAPLATIIENMCRFGGRGLPVVDEQGKVQGLVTVFDIFRTLLNTSEDISAVGKTAEAPALQ